MQSKFKLLIKGIFLDAIGMLSYTIPWFGEYTDILWAPISAYILYKMYPGTAGRIGSLVTFVEELVPFLDVVPTFTLTWIYKFLIQNEKPDEISKK